MTKTISGGQLQYLIEDYLCTLEDGENEEYCVSARDHARREIEGFVEWLNKRDADEPSDALKRLPDKVVVRGPDIEVPENRGGDV